jgi:hypothetical protein
MRKLRTDRPYFVNCRSWPTALTRNGTALGLGEPKGDHAQPPRVPAAGAQASRMMTVDFFTSSWMKRCTSVVYLHECATTPVYAAECAKCDLRNSH